jgi:hypothetical protein
MPKKCFTRSLRFPIPIPIPTRTIRRRRPLAYKAAPVSSTSNTQRVEAAAPHLSSAMATTRRRHFPLVPLLLSLLAAAAYGRLISDGSSPSSHLGTTVIRLASSAPANNAGECEQSYGFLPCTTTVFGNLFLVLAYGFLMFKAATYLSTGSELLLEIMGPGLVGGLLLPILGALPDALLVLGSFTSPCLLRYLGLCVYELPRIRLPSLGDSILNSQTKFPYLPIRLTRPEFF